MAFKYVPNGSGLFVPQPLNEFGQQRFSVTDGSGYTPRLRCKDTGFAANTDLLIYPPVSAQWTDTSGGGANPWPPATRPYRWVSTTGQTVNAYSTSLSILGDQWVFVSIDRLKSACNMAGCVGVEVGVLARFDPFSGFAGNGYFASGFVAGDGSTGYEMGRQHGSTHSVDASFSGPGSGGILIKVTGGVGQNIVVSMYRGSLSDFINNTMAFLGSFTRGVGDSDRFETGYPAVFGTSGGAFPDTTEADLSHWLAGEIGTCPSL